MEGCETEQREEVPRNGEAKERGQRIRCFNNKKKGGWLTFPFISGTVMGLSLAATGWFANIVVYTIEQYNMKEIAAAKLYNIAMGCMTFVSIVTAVLADSFFGSFSMIIAASSVSLLGLIMFTLSATISSLRPLPCTTNSLVNCNLPSSYQQGFIYATIAFSVIGGGANCLLGTIGADQFPKSSEHQQVFFNWFLVAQHFGEVIGYTIIVYIQSNVSWGLGFGIGVTANTIAIVAFLFGSCFYERVIPQKQSPFTSIARVLIASLKKLNMNGAETYHEHSYFYETSNPNLSHKPPSNTLRFLNRAAIKTMEKDDDGNEIQENVKTWSLCTVEEVEDLKRLIKVLPLLSAGIVADLVYAIGSSLVVLQALVMDRSLGSHLKIPAGSMFIFMLLTTCLGISILDRVINPLMIKMANQSLTTLQCIGVGYFLNILSGVTFALVEMKRLDLIKSHHLMQQAHATAPMSVFWLVIPLGLLGFGSSFYFSSLMKFYYQELPASLNNTALALIGLQFALGSYLGAFVLSVVQHTTSWLPDDINHGNIDYLYWVVTSLVILSFVYYVICAKFYKYNSNESHSESVSQDH